MKARWSAARLALFVLLPALGTGLVLWAGSRGAAAALPALVAAFRGLGTVAYALWIAVYLPWTLLALPAGAMALGSGFLFGWLPGFALAALGSALGSTVTVEVGRTLARPLAARLAARVPRFEEFSAAVERGGARLILLLRISPLIPFPVLNYALGLTRVRLSSFFIGSLVGMSPGNLGWAWLGSQVPGAQGLSEGPGLSGRAALGVGAVVLAVTAVTVWGAGRVLRREMAAHSRPAGPGPGA